MQNLEVLSQQAIKAALNKKWYKAIGINEQILKEKGDDVYALNRIGRAYAEIGDIKKAKEYFKQTLKHDPINQTAEKNLKELSKYLNHPKAINTENTVETSGFIMEPATTTKLQIKFMGKYSADLFETGATFTATMEKGRLFFYVGKDKVAKADEKGTEKQLANSWKGSATLLEARGKYGLALLKSPTPIFKDKKQDIRPYIKHERLEEIKLELPEE